MAELRQYEGKERQASVVVKRMQKENTEVGKLRHLASNTSNFFSDQTVQEFWAKLETEINEILATCVNGFRGVLAQADLEQTSVFSWVAQLEIMMQESDFW